MPGQYQTYMRGPINTRLAHAQLTDDMRQRLLDCLPVRVASSGRERILLNRLACWIEKYTLAVERARIYPPAEDQKASVKRILSAGQVFFSALHNADGETKRRIYDFLSADYGRVTSDFEGDDFTRGRLRFQQLMFLTSLVRSGAKRSSKLVGAGSRGTPMGDFVRVMKEVWVEATGLPFTVSDKRKSLTGVERPRLFVEAVLKITEELAGNAGRKLWRQAFNDPAAILYAMRTARKAKGRLGAGRTREEKEADRSTYRIR